RLGAALEPVEGLGQAQLGPAQASARGVLGDPEQFADLGPGELLPKVELEHDLLPQRQPPQGLEQATVLLTAGNEGRRSGAEIGNRQIFDVALIRTAASGLPVLQHQLARDAEQIAAKARSPLEALAALRTDLECPLEKILEIVVDLVDQEPMHGRVVTLKQLVAGSWVSLTPGGKQLGVTGHGRRLSCSLPRNK